MALSDGNHPRKNQHQGRSVSAVFGFHKKQGNCQTIQKFTVYISQNNSKSNILRHIG